MQLSLDIGQRTGSRLPGRKTAGTFEADIVGDLRRPPFVQLLPEGAAHDADMDAIDASMLWRARPGESHRIKPRNEIAGGGDRVDRLFAF